MSADGEVHDFFLCGFGGFELGGEAFSAEHEQTVADAEEFGELGRDHEDALDRGGELVDERVYFLFRADVDAAGDDDVGHAGRHDAVDGGTAEDVDEVPGGKKIVRLQEGAEGNDEDKGAERKQLFGEAVHMDNTPELNVSRRRSA